MHEVGNGLWEAYQDLRLVGANLGTRMNVVKTPDGLCVHSPIKLTDEVRASLAAIGEVKYVIAPNVFHHIYVGAYLRDFPEAKFYTIPQLAKKRPDLSNPIMIRDGETYPWSQELDHFVFRGGKFFAEAVFFHRASRTLVLTDFAFNIHDTGSRLANFMLKVTKSFKRFGQTGLEKLLIRDRKALRAAVDRIQQWDFDRISVTHGLQVESDGKRVFTEGMAREL